MPAACQSGGWGLVRGLGENDPGRGRPELPVESGVGALFPHLEDLGQGFFEHLLGDRVVGDAEAADLGGARAPADTELESTVAQQVQGGHPFGGLVGMVDGGDDVEDPRPDVDALGLGQQVGDEGLRL